MRLSFIAVTTDEQFMQLLIVRNESREGLTHDINELTLQDQKTWKRQCWPMLYEHGVMKRKFWYEPYLLYDDGWPVGYGLLKWDGTRYWMTAGLVKEHRGKGLSRFLISYITEMGHRDGKEVWIDVLDNNLALFGDIRVGYEFVEENAEKHDVQLHVMKHNRERILKSREAKWMKDHGKSIPNYDILEEMIEVDRISRNADIT
jgi:GNAT superfamily N-acetyltransferase